MVGASAEAATPQARQAGRGVHGEVADGPARCAGIAGQRWKVPRNYETPVEGDHGYGTPAIIHQDGKEQLLVWGGQTFPGGLLPFNYPPHVALLFAPLAALPLRAAFVVWSLAQAVLLVWLVRILWRLTRERPALERWLMCATALSWLCNGLTDWPTDAVFTVGQVFAILWLGLLVHTILAYPSGRLRTLFAR